MSDVYRLPHRPPITSMSSWSFQVQSGSVKKFNILRMSEGDGFEFKCATELNGLVNKRCVELAQSGELTSVNYLDLRNGQDVVCKYAKDGLFYRGTIVSMRDDDIAVKLVDFGYVVTKMVGRVYYGLREFYDEPPICTPCILRDVPATSNMQLHRYFKETVVVPGDVSRMLYPVEDDAAPRERPLFVGKFIHLDQSGTWSIEMTAIKSNSAKVPSMNGSYRMMVDDAKTSGQIWGSELVSSGEFNNSTTEGYLGSSTEIELPLEGAHA